MNSSSGADRAHLTETTQTRAPQNRAAQARREVGEWVGGEDPTLNPRHRSLLHQWLSCSSNTEPQPTAGRSRSQARRPEIPTVHAIRQQQEAVRSVGLSSRHGPRPLGMFQGDMPSTPSPTARSRLSSAWPPSCSK